MPTLDLELGRGGERSRRQKNGAGERTRTVNIHLGKVVLYQLSYTRIRVRTALTLPIDPTIANQNSANLQRFFQTYMNPSFSLLVKPSGADCNLRCEYCFYLENEGLYPETRHHRMSDEVLERMVKSFMATQQPQHAFGWQGGEPTLMGVDFFRRAVQLQKRHGRDNAVVGNGLQTNGTLLDAEFAGFLRDARFLTGISLDGPAEIHDVHRLDGVERGTHAQVMHGIQAMRDANAEFNILTLVSDANVHSPGRVYGYLADQGFLFHQYIPCVEPTADDQSLLPFSITGEQWGEFLCGIFDAWHDGGDTRRVSVRLFDAVLALIVDGARTICHFGRDCRQYFVVEHNGDVYPCDFFVERRWRLGNVLESNWSTFLNSPVYREFGMQKSHFNPECAECEYLNFCQGDCLKHRLCKNGGNPRRMSSLCKGWKMFYAHTLDRFRALARSVVEEREAIRRAEALRREGRTPGRNDPCPCGSGKKYKKCCGR